MTFAVIPVFGGRADLRAEAEAAAGMTLALTCSVADHTPAGQTRFCSKWLVSVGGIVCVWVCVPEDVIKADISSDVSVNCLAQKKA